jgi:hypothetical protein
VIADPTCQGFILVSIQRAHPARRGRCLFFIPADPIVRKRLLSDSRVDPSVCRAHLRFGKGDRFSARKREKGESAKGTGKKAGLGAATRAALFPSFSPFRSFRAFALSNSYPFPNCRSTPPLVGHVSAKGRERLAEWQPCSQRRSNCLECRRSLHAVSEQLSPRHPKPAAAARACRLNLHSRDALEPLSSTLPQNLVDGIGQSIVPLATYP